MNWTWIQSRLAIGWHARLIEQFGGAAGLRDPARLESALDRPRNLAAYQPDAAAEQLAALYGVGIAKAHAFVDGNKRVAFAVMVAFLKVHGLKLDTSEAAATSIIVGVADGTVTEDALAKWLRDHCRRE